MEISPSKNYSSQMCNENTCKCDLQKITVVIQEYKLFSSIEYFKLGYFISQRKLASCFGYINCLSKQNLFSFHQ